MTTRTVSTRQRPIEEVEIKLIGTAPMLVAHTLPWDIGGQYWERQAPEIAKGKIKRASASQRALLDAVIAAGYDFTVRPYDDVRGLDAYQETLLRGHWLPDCAPAFPVDGFKGAITYGATQYGGKNYGLSAKKLRSLEIFGDPETKTLARIKTANVTFDETMGVNSGMTRAPREIIRIRYDLPWETTLRIRYISALLNAEQIVQVLEWAGNFGVGQRRPSSPHGGQYGTFRVA